MDSNKCQFCTHDNAADAKYCSQCGGCLYLLPCPSCGAVNDVTTGTCHQCHNPLLAGTVDAPDSPALVAVVSKPDSVGLASRATEVARPLPHRHSREIVGTAVLAVIAVLGYYSYRQHTLVDAAQPSAANSDPRGRGSPVSGGVTHRDIAAVDTTVTKASNTARPATSLAQTPPAGPTPPAANDLRTGRQPVQSQEAKTAEGGSTNDRESSLSAACTEPVATLGLCAAKPVPKKEAETSDAIKAANVRSQAIDAGKARTAEPSRQESCTEARTALDLCAPTPTVTHTQRKE